MDGKQNCSNTVTIRDFDPPTVENVTLNSSLGTNYTNENLTVYYDVYDPQGFDIYNITNWFLNDTSIMLLNMPFEGGSTSTWTRDYTPYGNNGTVTSATWLQTGGYDGYGAYEFDGTSSYIRPPPSIIQPNTVLTIEARFKTTDDGTIIGYQNADIPSGPSQYVPIMYVGSDGKLRAEMYMGSANPITTTGTVNDGEWHHIVAICGSNGLKTYIDGVLNQGTGRDFLSILTQNGYELTQDPSKVDDNTILVKRILVDPIQNVYTLRSDNREGNEDIRIDA